MSHSLPPYVVIEKFVGETPLQALERYRHDKDYLQNIPIAYAGRLDPMASGLLVLLLGDECKRQKEYHDLDKIYRFSILLGVSSDTYDQLGRIYIYEPTQISNFIIESEITKLCNTSITLPYPPFSSKTVQGKPLYIWTLENKLHEIEIPTKTSKIHKINITKIEKLQAYNIAEDAIKKINKVKKVTDPRKALGADFRRQDAINDWMNFSKNKNKALYQKIDVECICSSGTYMRSIAHYIGKKLETFGIASDIHRIKIGNYIESENKLMSLHTNLH